MSNTLPHTLDSSACFGLYNIQHNSSSCTTATKISRPPFAHNQSTTRCQMPTTYRCLWTWQCPDTPYCRWLLVAEDAHGHPCFVLKYCCSYREIDNPWQDTSYYIVAFPVLQSYQMLHFTSKAISGSAPLRRRSATLSVWLWPIASRSMAATFFCGYVGMILRCPRWKNVCRCVQLLWMRALARHADIYILQLPPTSKKTKKQIAKWSTTSRSCWPTPS